MYRIMFIFRLKSTSYIYCVGMDYKQKAMFAISLYSPYDDVQLDYNTGHYPKELVEHLRQEKKRIDRGFYSIATWEMELYQQGKTVYGPYEDKAE